MRSCAGGEDGRHRPHDAAAPHHHHSPTSLPKSIRRDHHHGHAFLASSFMTCSTSPTSSVSAEVARRTASRAAPWPARGHGHPLLAPRQAGGHGHALCGAPQTRPCPFGCSSPLQQRKKVLLPEPLGWMTTTTCDGSTSKSMPSAPHGCQTTCAVRGCARWAGGPCSGTQNFLIAPSPARSPMRRAHEVTPVRMKYTTAITRHLRERYDTLMTSALRAQVVDGQQRHQRRVLDECDELVAQWRNHAHHGLRQHHGAHGQPEDMRWSAASICPCQSTGWRRAPSDHRRPIDAQANTPHKSGQQDAELRQAEEQDEQLHQ